MAVVTCAMCQLCVSVCLARGYVPTTNSQWRKHPQLDLGRRYDVGKGVPQDDAEAVCSYRLAAKRACFSLTWLLYRRFRYFDNLP